MSNTKLQKENIKYMKGIIKSPSNKLQRKWDRFNFDVGEDRNERNKQKLKELVLIDNI